MHTTTANLVGLLCALFALFCLLTPLPQLWNIRLPLYLVAVIWIVLRPQVALYLLPIAIPWGSLDTINVGLHVNSADILVALLAAAWLMGFALHSRRARDHETFHVPPYLVTAMLVLLLTMLLSMITAFSLSSSIKELLKWLEVFIIVLLGARYLRTRRQIWTLVIITCLAALSQAVYGYVQYFFNIGPQAFIRSATLRVYGTFDQPNPYAGYINMTLAITLALMLLGRDTRTRILAGFATLLLATAEYLSQSRGGEIAFAVALFFIVTLGMPRLRKGISAGVIGVLALVGGYLAGIVPARLLTPILRILGLIQFSFTAPRAEDYSTAERLAHWIAGINMFLAHPFIGVGIGNYPDVYPYYSYPKSIFTLFTNSLGHAHNYYINIAAEAGILGLTAFLLFLLAVFVAGGHAFRATSKRGTFTNERALAVGLLAALLTVCIHNMVDDLYVHSMTSLFALLLIALIRLEGCVKEMDPPRECKQSLVHHGEHF